MKSIEEIKADYQLFIDIQLGKYLKQTGKSEFSNHEEAGFVMNKIGEAYNKEVAAEHLRLDNLNKEAKTTWFNSIEIDFNEKENDYSEFIEIVNSDFEKISEGLADTFPFLPEGALTVLIFSGPALGAYGLPFERFKKLLIGEDEPTEIEEDALQWAFDMSLAVMGSVVEVSKAKRKQCLIDAVQIAAEELDEELAIEVVGEIAADMIEVFGEEPPPKKKKKK